jgi:hypothetical protein
MSFLTCQILGIINSQIKIERIFSVANVITNLQQSKLGIEHLDSLIFIVKNCIVDVHVG